MHTNTEPIRRVPFLDLRVIDDTERRQLLAAADAVFRHGRLVMGPEVDRLERSIAEACGRSYAVGVASGTDALFVGLKALGIGAGDEVITSALSWIATANAIALANATPVFADIREDLNIDPDSVARLITPRTKAIMPVHYTGKVCDMAALQDVAAKHRLPIIEDASQAFSARYKGRPAGSFGTVACFSMNPMKVFAALGEAGCVVTDDPKLRDSLVSQRYNGTINRETCVMPSLNFRIDTLQAAMLLARMPRLSSIIETRRRHARSYDRLLRGTVWVPSEKDYEEDVYYTYIIRTPRRDALKAHLDSRGIETKIQHPLLMPDQPAYKGKARGEFANARRFVGEILSLPIHEKLTDLDVEYVANEVARYCAH